MRLSENAIKVLEKRYLIKDEEGKVLETPQQMFERVASAVAKADLIYNPDANTKQIQDKFYEMMSELNFLPNSPTLMNAGRALGQLSACFVLPVEDTMEGIFEAIKQAALIHKSGGGTGFSFSRLRPKGATVNTTGGVASGPISFMKVFNAATEAVKQGGTRRGANMGILRIDHPDIMEFITCKQDNTQITNFNISVGITEAFMQAVEENSDYAIVDPHLQEVKGKLNAREVFNQIVSAAWQNGEPGIIFLDRLNQDNVVPAVGEIESTNPCGEQPLLPYESCNLGSVNLASMTKAGNGKLEVDYDKLETTVFNAVHFLDNVIDINKYPLKEIEEVTKSTRKIGLGVMGFADLLYQLGIPYNTEEGIALGEKIMQFVNEKAKAASMALAKQRGDFPLYEKSIYKQQKIKIRNATVTTIAPTGTLSIIAGVSSGIEPVFALSYVRNVMDNDKLVEVNPVFEEIAKTGGFYSQQLMGKIAQLGNVHDFNEIPEEVKRIFVTAHDVSPKWHIKMQAAFQRHTDNAVSKTVNFSSEATKENVQEVYKLAYTLGCKGVTIYRDGSRDAQVLSVGKKEKGDTPSKTTQSISPRPRPEVTTGFTERVKTGCGNLYITVNYDEQGICEVFTNTGKAGGCPSQSEAMSRLISISLRAGVNVDAIIAQLKGIRCPSTIRQRDLKILSCPDAIARVIEKVAKIQNGEKDKELNSQLHEPERLSSNCESQCEKCSLQDFCNNKNRQEQQEDEIAENKQCPECGKRVEHESGCVVCRDCGYSKCG